MGHDYGTADLLVARRACSMGVPIMLSKVHASVPLCERSPAWSSDGKFLYFIKDYRAIWPMPVDGSAKPMRPAQLWAQFPRTKIDREAIALTKDQAVIAIAEEASDLWLVEFPEK